MAKKRIEIGNLSKKKDGSGRHIKVNLNPKLAKEVTLRPGDYINFEMNDERVANLAKAVADGKLTQDFADTVVARIEKDKEFGALGVAYITVEQG